MYNYLSMLGFVNFLEPEFSFRLKSSPYQVVLVVLRSHKVTVYNP